ncbi:hypothetical protein ACOMHN_050225 [Nucella lapillus]
MKVTASASLSATHYRRTTSEQRYLSRAQTATIGADKSAFDSCDKWAREESSPIAQWVSLGDGVFKSVSAVFNEP